MQDYYPVLSLISGFAIIVAALVSVGARQFVSLKVGGLEIDLDRTFEATQDLEKDSRLNEARELLGRQESSAKWNRRANGSLTFGQYILGGVLATSFVQVSLSAQGVSLLGVLVLISSLVHQTYRPDLQARRSRRLAPCTVRLVGSQPMRGERSTHPRASGPPPDAVARRPDRRSSYEPRIE